MYFIYREIKKTFERESREKSEMVLTYLSIMPWISMPIISYYGVEQFTEVVIINGGFVVTSALFFWRELVESREINQQFVILIDQLNNENKPSQAEQFKLKCEEFNLTCREVEVVVLMLNGLKYKDIASNLFIAERTVTKHSQNIFLKVGVSNKFDLIKTLQSI
ncbi:helix-turn-helix transcriptional regulator [Pedobacter polaris]|nr:helix-turn-helix transcriptional regulator [Pedobacter polaris]